MRQTRFDSFCLVDNKRWLNQYTPFPLDDFQGLLDSRLWGPLHFQEIKGRALYGVRSKTDHGHLQTDADTIRLHDMSITQYELSIEDLISRDHSITAV